MPSRTTSAKSPRPRRALANASWASGCTPVLLIDNTKMSKSLGNFYTVSDILAKGYSNGHGMAMGNIGSR